MMQWYSRSADSFIEGHLLGVVVSLDAADPFDVAIVTERCPSRCAYHRMSCELEPG